MRKVYQHPSIYVHTNTVITEATGYVGNFTTRVKSDRGITEIHHGAAVIATGADEYKPQGYH
jgi:heterodisulfide reductase subunit A